MAKIVGIDLGTTNSVLAVIEGGRPVIIPNAEGGRLTPSLVAFTKDGKRLVGQLAKRQAVANPKHTIFSIKRRMGRQTYLEPDNLGDGNKDKIVASIKRYMGSDYRVKIDGKEYTPEEISAMILQKVKADAEKYLGEPIKKAVITVPAYFNDSQRQATKAAGIIAGLDVVRIINEPTAASLAYGLDREDVHTILVWDLGGGTFDVSILELGEGVFEVKAVNGNTWLGGDDWDQRIVDYLADEFQKEHKVDLREDKVTLQRLKQAAEAAKMELSEAETTYIRLPFIDTGSQASKHPEVMLTRAKFEEITADLLQKMVGPTKQALSDAGLAPEDIDRVVLVGGATRMPAVRELVRNLLGKEPYRDINPDEVVAIGAAIQAGILTGEVNEVVLIDVTPLSLGIETMGGIFTKIIQRNTTIPITRGRIFTTARDNQTSIEIHVLQGERAMARDNMTLDRFQLTGIPPQPRGEPRIEVTFNIDVDGIVHVSAEDLQTANKQKIRINSKFNELSEQTIEHIVKEAQIHAQQDKREREEVELNIRADSMLAAAEHLIKEAEKLADRAPVEEQVVKVEKAILGVKKALAIGDSEEIKSRTGDLKKQMKVLDRKTREEKRQLLLLTELN